MNLKFNKDKVILAAGLFFLKLLLDFVYIEFIAAYFSHQGFKLNFKAHNYIYLWAIFIASIFLIGVKIRNARDLFISIAYFSVIMPIIVMAGLDYNRSISVVFVTIFTFYFISIISRLRIFSNNQAIGLFKNNKVIIILLAISVVFIVVWYLASGVSLNLNMRDVYIYRRENAELAAQGFMAYFTSWTYKIFNVTLFALTLYYRKYFLAGILFAIQIFFFAASAHKGVLFYPVLVLGVWFLFRKDFRSIKIIYALISILLITLIANYVFDEKFLASLIGRRVFFVPAHLTFTYFEFFDLNPKVYWSNSFLSSFINYPYSLPMSFVIGEYLGDEELGANNGFIASGYGHAGYWGVIFYSIIISLILSIINRISKNIPLWMMVSITLVPLRVLVTASDLPSTLLTHGLIVAVFLLLFLRFEK